MSFNTMRVAATGLLAHGDRMQVISNNLANVSTTGFKKSDALFQTLISQQMSGGNRQLQSGGVQTSQIGKGVRMGQIKTSFLQGALEATKEVTDLAVAGNGFFGVTAEGSSDVYYTRNGVFRFDNQGYLKNSHGMILQGYEVDRDTGDVGTSPTDIRLPYEEVEIDGETVEVVRSAPRATSSVDLITNLDFEEVDNYNNTPTPFFTLAQMWNGNSETPLGDSFKGYNTAINVYDEEGNTHELNIYFDRVDENQLSNASPGHRYFEYVIGIDPDSDGRDGATGTSGAGLVSMGILDFDRYGEIVGQTTYSLDEGADPQDLNSWSLAAFNASGEPTFDVTWGAASGAGAGAATSQTIGMNFGVTNSNGGWTAGGSNTAAGVGLNADLLSTFSTPDKSVNAVTNYDKGSTTVSMSQDGYTGGYLNNIEVDRDGYLVGKFSNNQSERLFQVSLYRFNSEFGLRAEGNNLYTASPNSGEATDAAAGVDGRGLIYQNTLESSNVDMAEEFVKMIITQRGFQSNTKVMTTSDSILQTTISIKR